MTTYFVQTFASPGIKNNAVPFCNAYTRNLAEIFLFAHYLNGSKYKQNILLAKIIVPHHRSSGPSRPAGGVGY